MEDGRFFVDADHWALLDLLVEEYAVLIYGCLGQIISITSTSILKQGNQMKIADRIQKLGTETAFAVSAEAAAFAAKGNKVYPFHLGDMNILTPATVREATVSAMQDGKTGYCPNAGIPELRGVLADDVSASRGLSYAMENVAIQPGGKPTIGKFILALMNPGDEVLYPNPGYPIYESQIEFNGGPAVPYS